MTFDAREKSTFGGAPVELYWFTCGALTWTVTSGDVAQSYLGFTFAPEVLSRGEIDTSDEDQQGLLELTVARTNPVAQLYLPDLPPHPVMLTVFRFHRGDAEVIEFWSGEIVSARFVGSHAVLSGMPVSHNLKRELPPHTFQGQCNWALFSGPCGLAKASYRVGATLSAVSGLTITSSAFGAFADGYFRAGWVENADGERHWVLSHVGNTLTLLTAFRSLAAGAAVDAYPGCDRTIAACKTFGNLIHYCGFPYVPTRNPFVQGLG